MQEINQEQFKKLLEEEKYAEAQELLNQYFNQELTESEKGEEYVEAAMDYLTMANEVNSRYLESLNSILASVKNLKNTKNEYDQKIDVAVAQNKIKDM
jgi:hypothetical protein